MQPLPWDMIGAIVGGLSFLLTLLVEWNKLGTWRRIIIALVIGVAAFLVVNSVAPLLFPPQKSSPTETPPVATPLATTLASNVAYFFDDFNSGTDFNKNYWGQSGDLACTTQLKNGRVEFSSTSNNTSSLVCTLFAEGVLYEDVGSMEANITAGGGATGDYSIGIIEFSKGTFGEGTKNWIIQCGVRQIPNQNIVEVFFNVHSTYPQGEPEIYKTVSALAEHSYSMKLEIIPNTDKVVCYADGQVIGTYEGSNLASLHNEKIGRHLLGFWSPNSQATYYADDVKLSPPQK
jgi:hypothetical protein